MALTRHFYRPDEVLSALSWCILNHRISESVFWSLELFESDLGTELIDTLVETWAFSFGPVFMLWLYRFIEIIQCGNMGRDELVELVVRLAMERRRDNTVLDIIVKNLELDWSSIESISGSKEICLTLEESYPVFGKAVAYAFQNSKMELIASDYRLPDETRLKMIEWDSLLGRRKRREYKIPSDCLLFKTRRGFMTVYEDTLKELRHDLPQGLKRRRDFDRIFPDDIPDEWSKEDQEKSHSTGVLANKNISSRDILKKYILRWYPNISHSTLETILIQEGIYKNNSNCGM